MYIPPAPVNFCDNFAKFFESVCVSDSDIGFNSSDNVLFINNVNICNYSVSYDTIYDALCNIDERKGSGPDKIPLVFLKRNALHLSMPLFHIFNISLSSCFPVRHS